ncbi:gamma-glutamylcyclotransferase [Rhinatrema bivittatum]|uniref:gamma-glutamylcyclotransferase n=1 Tax=Rhinatrema bivittatum TaxID=194408 RepID=UPI0011290BCF|nr:gamma-glutamylcyclotransferase [Rhinatrema bivittatum]
MAQAAIPPRDNCFFYFAYGSNLLRERIQLRNEAPDFCSTACLQDFKLAFGSPQGQTSSCWQGCSATIVPSPGDEVWGVVWQMNKNCLSTLDKQEGVECGLYVPIEIIVRTQKGQELACRSYEMKDTVCGLPSPQYKRVICMGAKQNCLPTEYQKQLEAIETNEYTGTLPVMEEIEAALRQIGKRTN